MFRIVSVDPAKNALPLGSVHNLVVFMGQYDDTAATKLMSKMEGLRGSICGTNQDGLHKLIRCLVFLSNRIFCSDEFS